MSFTNNPTARAVLNQVVHDPRYPNVMHVPTISWPQISLVTLALAGFGLSSFAYLTGTIPLGMAMFINLITVYISFTPLHDASHRAVSSNSKLNDVLGTITGQLLLPGINMTVFRAIHMDHHRYTGEEGRDPDTGFVDVPKWAGVSYLMFADLHWVYWYFRYGRHIWSHHVKIWFYVLLASVVTIHAAFLLSPWWKEFLLLYVLPQRVGLGIVAYTFAHIQHPSGLTWENEPFQSTMYMKGNSPLRRLLFGQEDHSIHHLLPHVPWFKYKQVWKLANGTLRQQNIPGRSWVRGPEKIILPTEEANSFTVKVSSIKDSGESMCTFTFESQDGQVLPVADAGSHIDVHLSGGIIRQYSVVEFDPDKNHYKITVKLEENGRGGSRAMHELREGDTITISRPRNNFVLYENASKFILISGGIGITPLLAMSRRLSSLHKPFELHICARNESLLPYPKELTSLPFAGNITTHLDDAEGRTSLDAATVFGNPDDNTLLYLCGPQGFMDYLRDQAIAKGWKEANIQTESFSAPISKEVENHAFTAKLAKSQRSISVEPEQTLIDALHHAGIEAPYACMQGTCGTCLTGVIDGEADHRDAYLSETERKANDKLCLCVSRAKGNEITLDL